LLVDANGAPLTLDRFCDVLVPVITAGKNDHHDDYSIWLTFRSFNKSHDRYIQAYELETLIHIIAKSVSREQIRYFIDKVDWNHDGQLDFNEFRQFIIRGYARELLMMDITKETVYSINRLDTPTMTHQFC
jgi:Ca2+-binding EF-hand superfamily protein